MNSISDRFTSISDFYCFGTGGEDFTPYRGSIFKTRVVVGNHNQVGRFLCDRSHPQPLINIAIATTTEDDTHTTPSYLSRLSQNSF